MDDDNVPPKPEADEVVGVEAEANKDETPAAAQEEVTATETEEAEETKEDDDTTAPEPASEPAAEAASEEATPEETQPAAADDTTQDEPDRADARSDGDLAEHASELAAADDADPEEPEPQPQPEPEPESEPVVEAKEEEPSQAEPEPPSEDQPCEEVAAEADPAPEEPEPEVDAGPEEEEPPRPEAEPEVEADEEEAERGRSLEPAAEITAAADGAAEEPAAVHEDAGRSSSSLRRASGDTEALIHAAAKEVLERLEAQTMETIRNRSHSRQDSPGSANHGTELHYDVGSRGTRRESYKTESRASRRESYNTQPRSSRRQSDFRPASVHAEDGADSSSQHGDSDVFSDRSPRSSLGSFDDGGHLDHHHHHHHHHKDASKRSSHFPDDVSMSEMSYYDKEEFVPTIRGTNRMPFRSPSDVRALQYSSPTPSVTGSSYSPRSAKRGQIPTAGSRLGSPTVSGQFTAAKGRRTPTRFNPKKEPAPLVLLHVTLLPLRWQWAEILEQTPSDALSPEAKTLREAWHHLHDRVADTVCERGILLSHPQEDYEILEERLLEALDLPLRRRARVLECGHYVGPSNVTALEEDSDDGDGDDDAGDYDEDAAVRRRLARTHWCPTCRHDIRYEALGPGKIFRIKVYASNGLMRTGAWAACWKEMERVDVEIEPIVESAVLDELERLVYAQSQQLQLVKHDPAVLESTEPGDDDEDDHHHHHLPEERRGASGFGDRAVPALEEPPRRRLEENNLLELGYADDRRDARGMLPSSPSPAADDLRSPSPAPMPRYDESEERRLRDEERMREIYGDHPPPPEPTPEPPRSEPRHESFSAQSPPPPSPPPAPQQQQQPEPQQHHHHQEYPPAGPEAAAAAAAGAYPARPPQAFQNAGLGELLLEAARVFMQDKKNLAIVVMGLLVLFMAVRPAPRQVRDWDGRFVEHPVAPAAAVVSEQPSSAAAAAEVPPVMETVRAVVESVASGGEEADAAPAQVVVAVVEESTAPGAEAAEHGIDGEVPVAEAEPTESTSAPATAQTSAAEEETGPPVAEASSPSPSPSPSSEAVAASPSPAPVHETITTRELVRIVETVTETVKAVVTETEVVRVQATSGAAPEVPAEEAAAAASEAEEPLGDAAPEGGPAAETALPVEEAVAGEEAAGPREEEEEEADDHDEL
ncbi:hypothetical protein LX36DRAFT_743452 [Colletotrichum falcatum]|nr:hypothetical protein LX36DRAFT_743452 [Colletotrichum falcatum]